MAKNRTFAGIDVGTTTTKAVVIGADKRVLGHFIRRSGADLTSAATVAFEEAMARAGVTRDMVQAIVATGYGRKSVPFAHDTKTEIACHGRGCYHHLPEVITVVDIGGQDSKIIKLDAQGRRVGFKMNRKCAAGTGAFLEEIAHKLDISIGDLNGGRVVMTGGVVAFNPIVAELLSERAGIEVEIAPHPQEMGAFGAALFAMDVLTDILCEGDSDASERPYDPRSGDNHP
jgi:activator of 2-hydroxyglutaryl-CoA dehydratase